MATVSVHEEACDGSDVLCSSSLVFCSGSVVDADDGDGEEALDRAVRAIMGGTRVSGREEDVGFPTPCTAGIVGVEVGKTS